MDRSELERDALLAISLRERKKRATREALSAAALELGISRGLENVRVEDIAARASVSPRTYNNYFASREEAMCAIGARRAAELKAHLLARPAHEPITRAVIESIVAISAHPTPFERRGMQFVASTPQLKGEYLKMTVVIERALAEGVTERIAADPADMYPRVLAACCSGAVRVATDTWLDPENVVPLEALLREALTQAISGGAPC